MVKDVQVSLSDMGIDLNRADVSFYDPWPNRWTRGGIEGNTIRLPDFERSLVIRIKY